MKPRRVGQRIKLFPSASSIAGVFMPPNMLKSAFWAEAFLSKWKNTSFVVSCLVFTFWFWYNIKISWCLLCFLAVICGYRFVSGLLLHFCSQFYFGNDFLSESVPSFVFFPLCVCPYSCLSPCLLLFPGAPFQRAY